jgi:hypothetical protein
MVRSSAVAPPWRKRCRVAEHPTVEPAHSKARGGRAAWRSSGHTPEIDSGASAAFVTCTDQRFHELSRCSNRAMLTAHYVRVERPGTSMFSNTEGSDLRGCALVVVGGHHELYGTDHERGHDPERFERRYK